MKKINIFETGPRDGLQNESVIVPVTVKKKFIELLINAGLKNIEAGAFVSPKAVPQMADSARLLPDLIKTYPNLNFHSLVPNCRGLEAAVKCGVSHFGLLTSCSEEFNRRNLNADTEETLNRVKQILANTPSGSFTRIYLSMAFYSPWEGRTSKENFIRMLGKLTRLNFDEIVLSDTNGKAAPEDVIEKVSLSLQYFPVENTACHFHDTCGRALENIKTAAEMGISIFDSSAGGLGGCPYSPGATGNAATEDLLSLSEVQGWKTGIDPDKLKIAVDYIKSKLNSRE